MTRVYSARTPKRDSPPKKRVARKPSTPKTNQKTLTQLHFVLDSSVLRTCPLCVLSYTKGAPDDEALHRTHCGRVQRGMEWRKEEEREALKASVNEVATNVKLRDGSKGRIICFPASLAGKIGTKFTHLLETINLALASPPLTESILKSSKAYLFLLPTVSNSHREKIVGCVIAQRISTAMAIAPSEPSISEYNPDSAFSRPQTQSLVAVDATSGLFCHPTPLPTPLGIPRLFVPSAHRRQGIATRLLSAAAATFIHGCPLDPTKGQVAFTQPTEGGCAVMEKWGKGFVRIYEE
ncbi:hypothetical protein JVU11DRAFT_421 [Chiua virens]|nr:hypothetical protein JVU11DRAFT_421 [Chiua virens]